MIFTEKGFLVLRKQFNQLQQAHQSCETIIKEQAKKIEELEAALEEAEAEEGKKGSKKSLKKSGDSK